MWRRSNKPAVTMESDVKSCPHCAEEFKTKTAWKDHMLKAHNILAYTCDLCPKTFFDQTDFIHHFDVEHKNDCSRHICQYCGVSYKWFKFLAKHIRDKHQIEQLMQCSECGEEFYNSVAFKKHMRLKHNGSWKFYKCPKCYRKFTAKELVVLHDKFDHSKRGDQHFRDYAVTHLTNIEDEELLKNSKKCAKCNLQFSSSIYLMKHFKTTHNKQKYFRCCKCEDAFYNTRAGLSVHLYYEHGVPREHKCNKCRYGHTKTFVNKIRSIKESEAKNRSIEEELPSWARPFIRKDIPQNIDLAEATEEEVNNLRSNVRNLFHVLATVPPSKLRGNTVVDPYLQFYSARKKLSDDLRRDCRRRDEKFTLNTDKRPKRRIYAEKDDKDKKSNVSAEKSPNTEEKMNGVDDATNHSPITKSTPKTIKDKSKDTIVKEQNVIEETPIRPKRSKSTVSYREKTPASDDEDDDLNDGDDEIDDDDEDEVDEIKQQDDGLQQQDEESKRQNEEFKQQDDELKQQDDDAVNEKEEIESVISIYKKKSKEENADSITVNGKKRNKISRKSANNVKNVVVENDENMTKNTTEIKTAVADNDKIAVAKNDQNVTVSPKDNKTAVADVKIPVTKNDENVVTKKQPDRKTAVVNNDKNTVVKNNASKTSAANKNKITVAKNNENVTKSPTDSKTAAANKNKITVAKSNENVFKSPTKSQKAVAHNDTVAKNDENVTKTTTERKTTVAKNDKTTTEKQTRKRNARDAKLDLQKENPIPDFECNECQTKFTDKAEMVQHLDEHKKEEINQVELIEINDLIGKSEQKYRCDMCQTDFADEVIFLNHLTESHSSVDINMKTHIYKCIQCGDGFRDRNALNEHIKTHNECDLCDMTFKDQNGLKQHKLQNHKNLMCDKCKTEFKNPREFSEHSCGVASGENQDGSGNSDSPVQINKENHINNEDELPKSKKMVEPKRLYKCLKCESKFVDRELLLIHIKHAHNVALNKVFKCDQCSSAFKMPDKLKQHVDLKHKKQVKLPLIRIKKSKLATVTLESAGKFELINNLISNTLNKSMHNCKICFSYFPSKELLQRHIQWEHTKNVNLHKCGQCGHVLYSVEDLEMHMNSSHSLDTIVKWKKQIANTYVQQTDL